MRDTPALRSDAQARRERLLATATRLFIDEGLDVPMDRIARESDVGVGTLYRRFPDRGALLAAVITDGMARLRDEWRSALAEEPTAWEAFTRAVARPGHDGVRLRTRLVQAPEITCALATDPEVTRLLGEVVDAIEDVVRAAQAEGSMRRDVGAGDVALVLSAAGREPVPGHPGAAERARAVALQALSTRPHQELPGEPLGLRALWTAAD